MENNKLGTISLICGIVGLLLSCFVVGIIPCIASIVLSIMVLRDGRLKHGTDMFYYWRDIWNFGYCL